MAYHFFAVLHKPRQTGQNRKKGNTSYFSQFCHTYNPVLLCRSGWTTVHLCFSLPLPLFLNCTYNACSTSWLLFRSRIPTYFYIYILYIYTKGNNSNNANSNSWFAYKSNMFSHTRLLKPRRVCKVRQCIHSGKVHAEENGGAMSGFFLASKSRLGCRPVCPYSTQTCQTFHHQYEWAKVPHSFAVARSDLLLAL